MRRSLSTRLAALLMVAVLSCLGYTAMYAWAFADPEYDLTVDNIPVNFDGNKTLYLDTQTNDRGFVVYQDYLQIRSHYLSFYDTNTSYAHADTNIVSGDYCYVTVPSMNATLNSVWGPDNIGLSTDSGSVTVSLLKNTNTRIRLTVNSSNDAILNIHFYDLIPWENYKWMVDGNRISIDKVNASGELAYTFTGDWSSHILTLDYAGYIYFDDLMTNMLVVGFVIAMGAIMAVALLSRRRRG